MSESSNITPAFVAVGAAESYVAGEFGGPCTEADHEVSIASGVTTKIVGNNPERLALTIINLGATSAQVMFDNDPTSARGITLSAGGGFVSLNVRDDQMLPTREWYALTSGGATDIFAIETLRYALTAPATKDQTAVMRPAEST